MRIVVTGISSYLARTLFPILDADPSIEEIRGLDLKKPGFRSNKLNFVCCDVRDPDLARHMKGCDTIVHLAYIVMPIRNEALADDININGSKNVFRAAAEAGLRKIVQLSSIAAYGSWPDNPETIKEEQPVRGMPNFYYSRSKAEVEIFLDGFEKEQPQIVITRFRPSIFVGPTIDNAVRDIAGQRIMFALKGFDGHFQLAWDEDIARAIHLALKGDFHGAFNLAGEGTINPHIMANIMGIRVLTVPYNLAYWMMKVFFPLHLSPLSSGWIECMRYPIIVSSEKARKVLGWTPSHDTIGAFNRLLSALGKP